MPTRHLLPIPLPHGRSGSTGRLTVYFSPRLKDTGELRDYPEWRRWPRTATDLGIADGSGLDVRVNGAPVAVTVVSPPPSLAAWEAALRPRTKVVGQRFVNWELTPIRTVASSEFSERVLDLYVALARGHAAAPPGGADLLALPEAKALGLDADGTDPADPGTVGEATEFMGPMAGPDVEPEPPDYDVHEYVSLFGHHPMLLRHLGLAVDLELELPLVPTVVRVGTLYERTYGPGGLEVDIQTRTTTDFLPRPNPQASRREHVGGFLDLAKAGAFASIVDPLVTAKRLGVVVAQPEATPVPALATRALTLVRPDLLAAWENRTVRQRELDLQLRANLAGGPAVTLYSEDVTIGHRVDVQDQGTWRSLFARRAPGGYTFPRDETVHITAPDDEGWNTTVLVTEVAEPRPLPNADRDDPYFPLAVRRLDDALYRWDGWSGAVRRPGSQLDPATGAVLPPPPSEPLADDDVQVAVTYLVQPGSLPKLRFGRTYRMRARCVDLSGVSHVLAAATPSGAVTAPEPFGRLEPVAAPVVVRRVPRPDPGVGHTGLTVVLLGDHDVDDAAVAPDDRLLFPGRVGPDLVALHGLPNGGNDPAAYALLAERDARSLTDQAVLDPDTGELVAGSLAGGEVLAGPTRQAVAYLSDPAAGGVRFFLPEVDDEVVVGFVGGWPSPNAARLVVAAGPAGIEAAPAADIDARVFVPKAQILALDVSASLASGFLPHLALWQRLSSADRTALRSTFERGAHWMVSPRLRLTLVHAVRRPLLAPSVVALAATRARGSTAATFDGMLGVACDSTERVALTATWTDLVDDPNRPAPEPRTTAVPLGEVLVNRSDLTSSPVTGLRADLHDGKRHLARVDLEAFASFSAYFTERRSVTFTKRTATVDARGLVAGTARVTTDTGVRCTLGVDYTMDGAAGTISRLNGGAIPGHGTVTVQYVPLPVSRTSDEHGPAFEVLVPATIAPPPPALVSVLPAVARRVTGSGTIVVEHDEQVVRVEAARPWLVSGEGERLAMLVPDGVFPPNLPVTVAGRDPVVTRAGAGMALSAASFPRAAITAASVAVGVDAAAHDPVFDPATGRWVADVEVDLDEYRPFVQLVLARHQQDAVSGAQLSNAVVAEPLRLGVRRQITVEPKGTKLKVTVAGIEHGGVVDERTVGAPLLVNEVRATVQVADPAVADPVLRWKDAAAPVVLKRSSAAGMSTWVGTVTRPAGPVRVLVEEREPSMRSRANGRPTLAREAVMVEVVEFA